MARLVAEAATAEAAQSNERPSGDKLEVDSLRKKRKKSYLWGHTDIKEMKESSLLPLTYFSYFDTSLSISLSLQL